MIQHFMYYCMTFIDWGTHNTGVNCSNIATMIDKYLSLCPPMNCQTHLDLQNNHPLQYH